MTVASQVVRYRVDDSTVVGFEFEPPPNWRAAGPREVLQHVREAVNPAVEAAKVVLEKVKETRPDQVEVKFGIKASGDAYWIVAKAATEASFEVTLTWNPRSDDPSGVASNSTGSASAL